MTTLDQTIRQRNPFIEPFFEPLDSNGDYILPSTQYIANAAVLVVFAYLVALIVMEINYFRFAVWMAWRRMEKLTDEHCCDGEENDWTGSISEEDYLMSSSCGLEDHDREGGSLQCSDGQDDNDAVPIIDRGIMVMKPPQQQNQQCYQNHQSPKRNRSSNNHHHQDNNTNNIDSSTHSAIGHLLDDVRSNLSTLHPPSSPLRGTRRSSTLISSNDHTSTGDNSSTNKSLNNDNDKPTLNKPIIPPQLQKAYKTIHKTSLHSILTSLLLYTLTATLISLLTRGTKNEVIAVLVGYSKFIAAIVVFILSAKVPQWIGVYHEGTIRLAKCSSNLSRHFLEMDLNCDGEMRKLSKFVWIGVSFHFAKFYLVLLPFYCGVLPGTIPFSMTIGSITGLGLMWCIFLVHDRHRNHRNVVAFVTIFVFSVISSLLFVRGMAWIQVIWNVALMEDEDAFLVVSFFGWLVFMMGVHVLFVWNTLRMEKIYREESEVGGEVEVKDGLAMIGEGGGDNGGGDKSNDEVEDGNENESENPTEEVIVISTPERFKMKRTGSYDSFLFDPRFQDDSFRGYKERLDENDKTVGLSPSRSMGTFMMYANKHSGSGVIETPTSVIPNSASCESINDNMTTTTNKKQEAAVKQPRQRPDWHTLFTCCTPEYTKMSPFWKSITWIKGGAITITYLLCLYFVAVTLVATRQISNTKENLPSVRKALYETQNEGPVCAFDNRGAASNITTFENKEAAHEAGFLVLHCGACGACSTWENLIIEYTTRNNMAALANKCAMRGLFGGEDEITACIMEPAIGFQGQCAVCWMEDIVCTKKHCSFIFLQSQITNSVGNFAVGPDDITSATCEEAHCEVGAFVPCVGATRRRMNIVSSIARPIEEQCQIVDVDWAELFAEYV